MIDATWRDVTTPADSLLWILQGRLNPSCIIPPKPGELDVKCRLTGSTRRHWASSAQPRTPNVVNPPPSATARLSYRAACATRRCVPKVRANGGREFFDRERRRVRVIGPRLATTSVQAVVKARGGRVMTTSSTSSPATCTPAVKCEHDGVRSIRTDTSRTKLPRGPA